MHDDVIDQTLADDGDRWGKYFTALHQSGQFEGGSSIGGGQCMQKIIHLSQLKLASQATFEYERHPWKMPVAF